MPLLSLSARVDVTQFNPFAANEDHNFEGDSRLRVHLTAAPAGAGPVRIAETLEWWCAGGGWVGNLVFPDVGNPWGLNANVTATATSTQTISDVYDPYEHAIFMARAADPAGVQPDEWIVAQAPVAIDAATSFAGTIEIAPDILSPPQPPLPIDVTKKVFVAVRGPVEAYDLVTSVGGALVRTRTVVIAGQIVNWFRDAGVLGALTNPGATPGAIDLKVTLDDAAAGGTVATGSWFDGQARAWRKNLGLGDDRGFTMQQNDRVAAFLIHCPVPETFSFGTLTLEFVWPNGWVRRTVPVSTPAVDVLHWPVKMGDGQRLVFDNGPSPTLNGHTSDLHQHHAYDITMIDRGGTDRSMGASIQAVATGTVRGTHDTQTDVPAGMPSTGPANRIFMQHPHADGDRYSVSAHIRQGSATDTTGTIGAGTGIAEIGHNGSSSGPHLHLAYYRLNRFGRMQMLPLAFAMRHDAAAETVVGVPTDGIRAMPAPMAGADDPIVDEIGLFITTGNHNFAGTGDDVDVTIGGHRFPLSTPNRQLFQRGQTDRFQIPPWSGLRLSGLRGEITIHKSPDGALGGWNLDGVKVVVNGQTLLDAQDLDTWLSNEPWIRTLDWNQPIP